MNEKIPFDPSAGLIQFPRNLGQRVERRKEGRNVLVSKVTSCSLPSAAWRVVWGVQKTEQLGDQALEEWAFGPCSASHLLCGSELLASLFWGCFPATEMRTCTRQLLWAVHLRYSHSAISTKRQLRFGRDHRCSCDLSQQLKTALI